MRRKIENSRRFKETSSVQHTVPKIIRNALKCRHRTSTSILSYSAGIFEYTTQYRTSNLKHNQNHNRSY